MLTSFVAFRGELIEHVYSVPPFTTETRNYAEAAWRYPAGVAPAAPAWEKQHTRACDDDFSTSGPYPPGFPGGDVGLIQHPTNQISEKTIGAAIEVHRHLGPGLLESSYHACLCRELDLRAITYRSQVAIPLEYKGAHVGRGYVIDLLIERSLIVEIKSVDKLHPIHSAQLMTYMRLLGVSVGLLMNFNVPTLPQGIRRILY